MKAFDRIEYLSKTQELDVWGHFGAPPHLYTPNCFESSFISSLDKHLQTLSLRHTLYWYWKFRLKVYVVISGKISMKSFWQFGLLQITIQCTLFDWLSCFCILKVALNFDTKINREIIFLVTIPSISWTKHVLMSKKEMIWQNMADSLFCCFDIIAFRVCGRFLCKVGIHKHKISFLLPWLEHQISKGFKTSCSTNSFRN